MFSVISAERVLEPMRPGFDSSVRARIVAAGMTTQTPTLLLTSAPSRKVRSLRSSHPIYAQ